MQGGFVRLHLGEFLCGVESYSFGATFSPAHWAAKAHMSEVYAMSLSVGFPAPSRVADCTWSKPENEKGQNLETYPACSKLEVLAFSWRVMRRDRLMSYLSLFAGLVG